MPSLQNSARYHNSVGRLTVSFEEWQLGGLSLYEDNERNQWALGDWFLKGMEAFPERAGQEALRLGHERERLRQKAWVCSCVAPENREPKLTFAHHEAVASLPAEQQTKFLRLALEKNWRREQLREAVNLHKGYGEAEKTVKTEVSFDEQLSICMLKLRHVFHERPFDTWSKDERLRLKCRLEPWVKLYNAL